MKNIIALCALCAFLFLAAAPAQSTQYGPYLGAFIGGSWMTDADVKNTPPPAPTVEFDSGYALGVSAGYAFMFARIEAELAYQKNDMDRVIQPGSPPLAASGDIKNLSVLLNGYYDFTNHTAITPYVGAGFGLARVEVDNIVRPGQVVLGDKDTVFAYQVGAGVAFALSDEITLDLKYRFYGTPDVKLRTEKIENRSHNILLGVRYSF